MSACEYLPECPFFKKTLRDMPEHAELFKTLYCKDRHTNCARYIIAKQIGPDAVPEDIFPNHVESANELLASSDQAEAVT